MEKPKTQKCRIQFSGLANPSRTTLFTGPGPGLAQEDNADRVYGRFWYQTEPSVQSGTGFLVCYLDPLPILVITHIAGTVEGLFIPHLLGVQPNRGNNTMWIG